ncbi:Rab GTPase activating protein [Entamoeba marina]
MSTTIPFPHKPRPQQPKSFFSVINSLATSTVNTLSSTLVPHYTYEGNPHVYDAVCDCLNSIDYKQLEYQCSNGVPYELRPYVWYALLLKPSDPWEIKRLYSDANGNRYKQYKELIPANKSGADPELVNGLDEKTIRVIDCDVVRTFPEGAEYIFREKVITDLVRRILQIYVTNHIERGYFQGLNDIVGTLLLLFLEPHQKNKRFVVPCTTLLHEAEATTYFILEKVMDSLYPKRQTTFHCDLLWTEFVDLIQQFEITTANRERLQMDLVKQQTYRWFVCLFCREFHYKMVFAVWDNCVLKNGFRQFIKYLALSLLVNVCYSSSNGGLETFNTANKRFFNNMTEDNLSYLITLAYNYKSQNSR